MTVQTPCREWQGSLVRGYGHRRRTRFSSNRVHRQIMEMVYGPEAIKGKVVMHLCDNPACFRFDHLRIGSQADNLADMAVKGRGKNQNSGKTHCPQGHPYDEANTYVNPNSGRRTCRACQRLHHERRKNDDHSTAC